MGNREAIVLVKCKLLVFSVSHIQSNPEPKRISQFSYKRFLTSFFKLVNLELIFNAQNLTRARRRFFFLIKIHLIFYPCWQGIKQ